MIMIDLKAKMCNYLWKKNKHFHTRMVLPYKYIGWRNDCFSLKTDHNISIYWLHEWLIGNAVIQKYLRLLFVRKSVSKNKYSFMKLKVLYSFEVWYNLHQIFLIQNTSLSNIWFSLIWLFLSYKNIQIPLNEIFGT